MEFPDLEQTIHQHYSTDEVRVVGIYPAIEPAVLVQDFQEQTGVTFPLVVDETFSIARVEVPRGTDFPFPRDVVIDQDLVIRSNKNSFDSAEMRALIDELLAAP